MKFYTKQHRYYCGIDLHARSMYICILNNKNKVLIHKKFPTKPEELLAAIKRYKKDIVVAVECIFSWYWVADLCQKEKIPFILGHALYMKAIHGGKAKNDRIDAYKIAALIKSGMFPMAYVYPEKMRATRDLLRRRCHLAQKRAELLAHIENTNHQYNLPPLGQRPARKKERQEIAEHFPKGAVRDSIQLDIALINEYDRLLTRLEHELSLTAKVHDADALFRIRSIPGIGRILGMTILYEIQTIKRFPRVQNFVSYCRLVKCAQESDGKKYGYSGKKIGNAHLRWAFGEAATLFLRRNPEARKYKAKLERKHGKAKAMTILAHKLARAVYYMLKRKTVFDMDTFFAR